MRSSFQYTEADVFLSDLFRKALSEVDRLGIRHILVGVAHLYPRLQREVRGQLVAVGTPVGLVGLGLVVAYGKAEELALKGLARCEICVGPAKHGVFCVHGENSTGA